MRTLPFLFILFLIPSIAFGGACLDFVTTNDDRVNIGDVTTFDGATELSIHVRIKFDSLSAGKSIITKWGDLESERAFTLETDNSASDEIRYALSNGSATFLIKDTTDADLAVDTWYSILAVWSGGNTMTIYKNGTSLSLSDIENNSISSIINSSSSLQIGHQTDEPKDGADGKYCHVAMWRRALSESEALELSSGVQPMFLSGGPPDGYWPLWDESTQVDLSKNGNDGSLGASSGGGPDVSNDGPKIFQGGLPI